MIKYLVVILIPITFFCVMMLRGYSMYIRSGGKRKIVEKIKCLESSEEYIKLENISPVIIFLTIVLEDKEYFYHKGINIRSVGKAVIVNIKRRRIAMGGSTVTQQLAKNLLFDFKKTFTRKFAEIFAVAILEKNILKKKF